MNMELTTYTELEVAHRLLAAHTGRCKFWHGHRFEVEISVRSATGDFDANGMIVDFKRLKEVVRDVLDDKWDHSSVICKDDPLVDSLVKYSGERVHVLDRNPTLEYVVTVWADLLQKAFESENLGIKLTQLKASETAKNTVTYRP